MQPSDVKWYGRDYSATDWEPHVLDQYQAQNPNERPVQFLGRYIGYPTNPKCISHYPGLYQRHLEHGRPSFFFHQIGYTDMAGGYEAGRAHAQTAWNDAKSDRVRWDGESHIVACMDRYYVKAGFTTLTREGTRDYMRGFRSVLGDRAGYYGFWDSMQHALAEGWASFYVQCGARSAHVPGIHAWQENNYQPKIYGIATDILELYCSPAYAFEGENDMELTDRMTNAWGTDPTVEEVFRMIDYRVWLTETKIDAQSAVLAQIAENTDSIHLSDEQMAALRADNVQLGEMLKQTLTAKVEEVFEGIELDADLGDDDVTRIKDSIKNMLYTQMFVMTPKPQQGT